MKVIFIKIHSPSIFFPFSPFLSNKFLCNIFWGFEWHYFRCPYQISSEAAGQTYQDALVCTVFYALIKFSLLCLNTSTMTRHCKNLSLKVANWYTKVNLLWRPIIGLIKLNFTMWIIKSYHTHVKIVFIALLVYVDTS